MNYFKNRKKQDLLIGLKTPASFKASFEGLRKLKDFDINSEGKGVIKNYWEYGSAIALIDNMKEFDGFDINIHAGDLIEKFKNLPKGNLISRICECDEFDPKKAGLNKDKVLSLFNGESNDRCLGLISESLLPVLEEETISYIIKNVEGFRTFAIICNNLPLEKKEAKEISSATLSRVLSLRGGGIEEKAIEDNSNTKQPSLLSSGLFEAGGAKLEKPHN